MTYTPTWLLALMLGLALILLWRLHALPRSVRITLSVPIIYFAAMYLVFTATAIDAFIRQEINRVGVMVFALAYITMSLLNFEAIEPWRNQNARLVEHVEQLAAEVARLNGVIATMQGEIDLCKKQLDEKPA